MHYVVRLSVGPRVPEGAPVVVARVHHRQHHVGHAHEVFPHLPDAEITGRHRSGEPEDVERDGNPERPQPVLQQRHVLAHRLALGLPRPVRRENCRCHPFPRLVGEAHIVELHLPEAHLRGFLRQLGGVDPDGVVVGVHPGDVDPVAPQLSRVAVLDRPRALAFREERILRHHDARDGIDAVSGECIEPSLRVLRSHAPVRADLLGRRYRRRVEQAASVILHVDHEGVDLGLIREAHELP